MPRSILAIITEIDPSLHPSHPIVLPPETPVPPLEIWGGAPPTYPDIGGPQPQPRPEHPIVIPPEATPLPPTIWPNPPEGSAPLPEHPIVIPPIPPDQPPAVIWPNPPEGIAPLPEHPIVIPPGQPLRLRYALYIHSGIPPVAELQKRWEAFAKREWVEFGKK